MRSSRLTLLAVLVGVCALAGWRWTAPRALAAAPAQAQTVRFNRDIRPILTDNCFYCHGPDSGHRKVGLRFDRQEGLFAKREKGTPVVPGKPAESLMWQHITSTDPDEIMPPPASHKTLTAEQKEKLTRWIEQGAIWEPQWSFVAPVRPALPAVKNQAWARNPIDRFVLARLEAEGLTPAPEADRGALLRRVTFDLTGLPPTPQERQDFLADKSPDAYEKVVDRLLASPHYGEQRAHYWLDAARYGDTHGLHFDNYREIWPYRDWVISAYNRDEPFDQFTIDQIAGDLLPTPPGPDGAIQHLEHQIASGFNRCNITTNEGGSIPDEVAAAYAKDRTDTTGTVFLGLTVGCATCHDHKFDPITQKEFYQLTAFFRNTTQKPLDGNVRNTAPVVVVPSPQDRPQWESAQKELSALKQKQDAMRRDVAKQYESWAKGLEPKALHEPLDPKDQDLALPLDEGEGKEVRYQRGAHDAQKFALPRELSWTDGPNKANKEKAVKFGKGASLVVPEAGDFDADHAFSLGAWVLVPPEEGSYVVASKLAAPDVKDAKGDKGKDRGKKAKAAPTPGWVLEINNRTPTFRLIGATPGEELKIVGNGSLRLQGGKWHHVFVTYDGSRSIDGVALFVDGKPQYSEQTNETRVKSATKNNAPLRIGSDGGKRDLHGGAVRDFRVYSRELVPEEIQVLAEWHDLQPALAKGDGGKLTRPQADALRLLYLNRYNAPYHGVMERLADTEQAERPIRRRSPVTLVMEERTDTKPIAHVLNRGQYDQPREEVQPGTPAALHPFRPEWPRNRLGLAYWLVDEKNPLTARVEVNRLWQELFGQGIVRTSEDFGMMGTSPTHPQLLDWMAVEFREGKWDVKRMLRLMVTSATYRQSSAATKEKLSRDPLNELLSRGPRFRMDAEQLRDMALASSGLLVDKIGGPSVKPYQPPGVWEAVAMNGSDTRSYVQDTGEGLYRRSLYTFWKRAAPPASLDVFNAPSRETCTVRRERTDTPLQALVTMNDPQWVEAARRLAERALSDVHGADEASDTFDQRLDFITLRVLDRPMDPKERNICRATLGDLLAHYREKPEDASKLIATGASKPDPKLSVPDLAAWTMLASQVMNTDEALNK